MNQGNVAVSGGAVARNKSINNSVEHWAAQML